MFSLLRLNKVDSAGIKHIEAFLTKAGGECRVNLNRNVGPIPAPNSNNYSTLKALILLQWE